MRVGDGGRRTGRSGGHYAGTVTAPESRLALVRRARRVNRTLAERYPDARCELDFTTPAGAARRDGAVRADHRRAGQPRHPDPVRALPRRVGVRRCRPDRARGAHPQHRVLPGEVGVPHGPGAGARRAVRRRGARPARGPRHAAGGRAQDGERRARQRVRGARHHRRHTRRPARAAPGLDGRGGPREGRARRRGARRAPGVDDAVPPVDLPRAPDVLRQKPACGACPVARDCPSFGIGETDPVRAAALVKPGPGPATPAAAP